MRRVVFVVVVCVVGAAVASVAAFADPPPLQHLGAPDGVSHFTLSSPVEVQSGQCPGFVAGDSLMFSAVAFNGTAMFWQDTPLGVPASREIEELSGSTTSGSWTYTIRGHFDSGATISENGDTSGKATITRSDGAKMSGDAFMSGQSMSPALLLQFVSEVRCG
jgi:hypothetical protein